MSENSTEKQVKEYCKTYDNQRKAIETAVFLGNIAVSMVFLFFAYRLWEKDFHIPIVYSGGDGVGGLVAIRKAIEGTKFSEFNFWCAPYGESLYAQDYVLPYLIIKLLAVFISDVGVMSNVFWIVTYILTAMSMYVFLKKIGCSWIVIIAGSTLYNFLPYHYFRLEHYWLMGCYVIPLVGYMAVEMLEERNCKEDGRKEALKWFIHAAFALIIGLNGLYYSVCSIMVLAVTLFYAVVYKKRYRAIVGFLIDFIGIVLPVIAFYVIPTVLSGTNEFASTAATRDVYQINLFGLQLVLLFLPIPGHRIAALSNFTEYCYEQMNIFTENYTESLGLVMSIGLIISILLVFKNSCHDKREERIRDFGIIILIVFIVSTVGGLDNFIAIFVSPAIRCYNRMSIYIALFAVGTVCLLLDRLMKICPGKKKYYCFMPACVLITVVGVLDMTSPKFCEYETYDISKREYICDYDMIGDEYDNDVKFFERVNAELDEEKMLFILPYNMDMTKWDEEGFFHRIKTCVVQPQIRISYSHMDGKYTNWWTNNSRFDVEAQIKLMCVMGYSGILIDKTGFGTEDNMDTYIDSISEYIDENSKVVSDNDNLIFYSIKDWKKQFLSQYSEAELQELKDDIYLSIYYDYKNADIENVAETMESQTAGSGNIQFNSCIKADEGKWQVVFWGKDLSNAEVKVTDDSEKYQMSIINLEKSDDYVQYEIDIDRTCDGINLVLDSSQNSEIYRCYYMKKADDKVELLDIVRAEKELMEEFGYGRYMVKVPLQSFKIQGAGKIAKDEITIHRGALQYGPYLHLESGDYQVCVRGQGLKDVDFRVTGECGLKTMKCRTITQTDTKLVYEFNLYEPTDAMEFLIGSSDGDVYIEEYELTWTLFD